MRRILTISRIFVLWRLTTLCEELAEGDDGGAVMTTRQDELLEQIEELAVLKAESVFRQVDAGREPDTVYGSVRPREGMFRYFQRSMVLLWRIEGLDRNLWLGVDGKIYYGYESFWGHQYWKIAEINKRTEEGLQRIVDALS